jgi:uncharacterized protein YcbX
MRCEMSTEPASLPVTELWRYPVKSMSGERLARVAIGASGIDGDRRWALLDRDTGLTLTARRVPELLEAQARVVADGVEIELPDGTVTADDAVLSAWLGRAVELRDATTGAEGTYEIALDDDGAPVEHHDWVRWTGPSWSFHDSTKAQVSLLSTATIGGWDRRRFRANVVLEADTASIEDGWVGRRVEAGQAILRVTKPIDRCVMVTRPQRGGIERDLEVLRTIARERSGNLAVGALVERAGVLGVGDRVQPLDPG